MTEENSDKSVGGDKPADEKHKLLRKVPFIGKRIAEKLDKTPVVPVLRLTGVIGEEGGACGKVV